MSATCTVSSGQMPGGFGPILNRHKKGARKARREALGLPDPEPTPRRKRKIPKHRRQQPSVGQGHVCHERFSVPRDVANMLRLVKNIPVTPTSIDAIAR